MTKLRSRVPFLSTNLCSDLDLSDNTIIIFIIENVKTKRKVRLYADKDICRNILNRFDALISLFISPPKENIWNTAT